MNAPVLLRAQSAPGPFTAERAENAEQEGRHCSEMDETERFFV